jgi:hypothetical protein
VDGHARRPCRVQRDVCRTRGAAPLAARPRLRTTCMHARGRLTTTTTTHSTHTDTRHCCICLCAYVRCPRSHVRSLHAHAPNNLHACITRPADHHNTHACALSEITRSILHNDRRVLQRTNPGNRSEPFLLFFLQPM